jgi:ABC-type transport system involved in multi-copper enzyme maturation permease subunit
MEMPRASIGNDFFDIYLSFKFELLRHWKRRRLLIVAALAVFVPLIFYAYVPDDADIFAANSLDVVRVVGAIIAALLVGDAVCSEFERKTGLVLFPTPQRRFSIFLGKYFAALLPTLLAAVLYYVTITLQIAHLYGWAEIPVTLWKSFLIALLTAAAAVSVIFFFSSLLKRSVAAIVSGFMFLWMFSFILEGLLMRVGQEPWFLVSYSSRLIVEVLGVVSELPFNPEDHADWYNFAIELTFNPDLWVSMGVLVAYTFAGLAGGMALAVRREL